MVKPNLENMGKWTDDLHAKDRRDAEAKSAERAGQIKNDQLVYEKGPEFWNEAIQWMKHEAEDLKVKFGGRADRNVNIRELPQQIRAESGTFPQTVFIAPLAPSGKSLLIDFVEHRDRHDQGQQTRTEVAISVDESQHIHFDYEGTSYIHSYKFGACLLNKLLKIKLE